ncbi:MAG: adenylate/guanylate cyclase domain-containing protein [Chloroflexi bacterium]|nr:adenylate/guanylate cyclase domain-containing protein [Chloroflexota bacterium]MDA1145261.1 adenylate/guanylate cyclase domain-containing protein [Chloroflexota bacterium]
MPDELAPTTEEPSKLWEAILSGEDPKLRRGRRIWGLIPSEPRCKLCSAPFSGPGAIVARAIKRSRGTKNPAICLFCEHFAGEHPGGATVEMTIVFADVRHSTELSQSLGNAGFGVLMGRFYDTARQALTVNGAFVDKLVGDAVNGFFLPGFAGSDHIDQAIEATSTLLRRTKDIGDGDTALEVGAGIHTGEAYMGSVGVDGDFADFTALGEAVNLASRLSGAARGGEILVSHATLLRATRPPAISDHRQVTLKGFEQPVEVDVIVPA